MKKLLATAVSLSLAAFGSASQAETLNYGTTPLSFGGESDLTFSTKGGGGLFATMFGAPSALGAPKGTAYASINYANPRGGVPGNSADGDVAAGFFLGNPISAIGVRVGVDVTGLDPFGDTGSFSVSANRFLFSSEKSVMFAGVSGSGLGGWGTAAASPQYSGYVTRWGEVNIAGDRPYTWTVGYGQDAQFVGNGNTNKQDGVFWGAGIGVTNFLSASVSGTTNSLNAGVGLQIPGVNGLSVSAGYYDITNEHNRRQASVSVGYSTNVSNLFGR